MSIVFIVCILRGADAAPTLRPTVLPTAGPTYPTALPTRAPTYMASFTCSYSLTNSDYGRKAIYDGCPQILLLCPGDTVNIGSCDASNKAACVGDQYFMLQKEPYGNNNIAAFNDDCAYLDGRVKKTSKCSFISYTVPTTDLICSHYGLVLACGGTGTCGGDVLVSMPGTPSLAPTAVPTLAPVRRSRTSPFGIVGEGSFKGEVEFIGFVIALVVCIFLVTTFVLCLRLNPRFNSWFWSLEFFSKSFLGHQMPGTRHEPKQVCSPSLFFPSPLAIDSFRHLCLRLPFCNL